MSGFSSEWLALREPLDLRARNRDVLDAVAAAFRGRQALSIVDLGSGTGSTVRALSARLPTSQAWRLVDNDSILLAEAFAMARPDSVAVETQQFDLNDDVGPLLDRRRSGHLVRIDRPCVGALARQPCRGRRCAVAAGLYRADL